jgi:hypothetical protein
MQVSYIRKYWICHIEKPIVGKAVNLGVHLWTICYAAHHRIHGIKLWKQVALTLTFPWIDWNWIMTTSLHSFQNQTNLSHKDVVFCRLISYQKLQQSMISFAGNRHVSCTFSKQSNSVLDLYNQDSFKSDHSHSLLALEGELTIRQDTWESMSNNITIPV